LLAVVAPSGVEASTAFTTDDPDAQSRKSSGDDATLTANAIAANAARGPARRPRARFTVRALTRER
jgi:hypothetical protein